MARAAPPSSRAPRRWPGILRQTVREIIDDNCLGLAAQLAFYFLLALFPALLFVVALIGYLPLDRALDALITAVGTVAPTELVALLSTQIEQLTAGNHASLLTLGILGAIWSSSAATVAIIDALNRAYDVGEWRPWWKRRLVAIGLTLTLAVFMVLALLLMLMGPGVVAWAAEWLRLAPAVPLAWSIARWPLMFACMVFALDLIYHFAPNRSVPWRWVTPGALLATVLWIVSSFGFKFYLANVAAHTATYGAIGGAVVTMMWFYVSGLAILVGAELNGVVEQARRQ